MLAPWAGRRHVISAIGPNGSRNIKGLNVANASRAERGIDALVNIAAHEIGLL
jgi:hypothetical protein